MKTTIVNRFVKTTALAAFMFIAFTMSAFAKPTDVSKYLTKQFQKQFQNAADVTWKTTDNFTSATFTLGDDKMSVFYNTSNNLIGISKNISLGDLPKAAQQVINTEYSNYGIMSVIDFTDGDGIENYYIQLQTNGKQVILQSDAQGHITDYLR